LPIQLGVCIAHPGRSPGPSTGCGAVVTRCCSHLGKHSCKFRASSGAGLAIPSALRACSRTILGSCLHAVAASSRLHATTGPAMPGGVLATSGEVGKASEEACGVLTVSNKIAPPRRQSGVRARGGKASQPRAPARELPAAQGCGACGCSCDQVGAARPRPLASATRDSARRRASGLGAHARRPREARWRCGARGWRCRSLLARHLESLPT